jgi:hypothetical protein
MFKYTFNWTNFHLNINVQTYIHLDTNVHSDIDPHSNVHLDTNAQTITQKYAHP